ncbi:MAG: hypothetical protein H6601_01815 [Flavobacteriales bacterium]|nr:hypothetical protein [Flavobacteriales bacterium]
MKHLFAFSLFLISTLANAQTVCDSLDFVSIKYSPFTDSIIIVDVENNNPNEIFSYPGFVLLNENGDTLAKESVFYFGIGEESVHSLDVRAGVHDPIDNFTGTLKLYSGFYETFECEWDLDQSLCANAPCDSLVIGFQNWGGALVLGSFAWSVLDSSGTVIESGVLDMTVNEQYWFHGLCLEPGEYSYNLYALGEPSGGGPTMTVSSSTVYAAPTISMPFDWFSGNVMEVPFYMHCVSSESPNSISETEAERPFIHQTDGQVSLQSRTAMLQIDVISADGKLIGTFSPNTNRFSLTRNFQ